jgi:hypothetical protein
METQLVRLVNETSDNQETLSETATGDILTVAMLGKLKRLQDQLVKTPDVGERCEILGKMIITGSGISVVNGKPAKGILGRVKKLISAVI